MREYQTILIVNTNLDEAGINAVKDKLSKALAAASGKITNFENLGKRELATYFDKQRQGYFLRVTFESESNGPTVIATLARNNDEIIRQITVNVETIATQSAA